MKRDGIPYRRALWLLATTGWRADRRRTIGAVVLQLTGDVADLAGVYCTKLIVDAATTGRPRAALAAAVACGLTVAGTHAARSANASLIVSLRERTMLALDERILGLVTSLPGLSHHERPELLDRIELLRQERWALGSAVNAVLNHGGVLVQVVLTVVLLVRLHPILALLPVAGYVMVDMSRRGERISNRANESSAPSLRLAGLLEDVVREPDAAGELRMHAAAEPVYARHSKAYADVERSRASTAIPTALLDIAGNAVLTFAQIGAVAFVALRAVAERGTPGDVLLIIGLVLRVGRQIFSVSYGFQWLLTNLRAVGRLAWLSDEVASAVAAAAPAAPAAAPDHLRDGIVLEHVTFAYPGTPTPVLRDVTLRLPAGATVALVGENGAGKTTLVKLLCRFYEPTSGRITVDGTDLRSIPVDAWRERLSGAFQDFARFDLLAGEVVGVGDAPRVDDRPAAVEALERAGAERVVHRLPDGLETLLGTSFEGGVEPSGGQWQQLALGRGMMRRGPLLLVLDEPTAAIDPETEHRLFERYAAEAEQAARDAGAISVLVSHRFSTVRMADLIVVLEDGRVIETGSHEELMAAGALYAELFTLQARAYA